MTAIQAAAADRANKEFVLDYARFSNCHSTVASTGLLNLKLDTKRHLSNCITTSTRLFDTFCILKHTENYYFGRKHLSFKFVLNHFS